MSARLLIDVWQDIADPWSRIGLDRLLRGIDLARAGREEVRGSAADSPLDPHEVVIDVHSFLSPGDPLPKANADAVAAVAESEGIPIAEEKLRHPPSEPLRRLAHRIVHAVRGGGTDPADGARQALEAVIRLDDWFLGPSHVFLGPSRAPEAGTQAENAGQRLTDESPSAWRAADASPATLGRLAGLAASALPDLEKRLEFGEWETDVDQDIADAKRLRIRGLPLTVVGGRVMLVGAQSPKVFAKAILDASAAIDEDERSPETKRFLL